jgi:hypothetical protein
MDSLVNLSLGESITSLELCRFAVYSGNFREAEKYYDDALQRDPRNATFIIDYAKMLYKQCLYGRCSAYVSEKLQSVSSLNICESQVLNIIKNAAFIYSQGTLGNALKEAREVHQKLRVQPMEELGDLEVRSLTCRRCAGRS